jgi:FtsP/CotA-like multicopper oxidase with cupredoxin domain
MWKRWFLAAFAVVLALTSCPVCRAAGIRHYYIAAEDVSWDYAPSGRDLTHGRPIPKPWGTQTRWTKTRYLEYTDATFSTAKPQPLWLGILGPIIRAEVGDTVIVEFLNRSAEPHSMHPHGLRYDKANEGAHYLPAGAGGMIAPGARYTYRWHADQESGPGPGDPSSIVWWYHSHVDTEREINAGLLGPIIVTAAGKANADGTPKDVDRELIAMFMIFDEQGRRFSSQRTGDQAGLFYSINGYIFGNLPDLTMKQGERVRWYLLGMGSEEDLHSPHWHGKVVTYGRRHTDVVELLPGSMATVDMKADNPGTWMFHCHVLEHMEAGMMASYTIYSPLAAGFCPIAFVRDSSGADTERSELRIRNVSSKPMRRIDILSASLVTYQDLEPSFVTWSSAQSIAAGQVGSVPVMKNLFHADRGLGWVFFPSRILYEDGTEWKPRERGQCHEIYWREKEHLALPVLPPFQFSQHED